VTLFEKFEREYAEKERQRLLHVVNRKPGIWSWLRDRWLWLRYFSWQ